jgi:hypothetical protein
MDWTPGVEVREQYAYGYDDDGADRWPDIVAEYLTTVQELDSTENAKKLRNAVRWFSAGTRAPVAEDQFQYFWFVLEILAESSKEKQLVTDKCQRSHGNLFCKNCDAISQHRPFPKQAIEALLTRVNVSTDRQRDLFRIRNGIMHGDTREEIESDIRKHAPEFGIADAVDFTAHTAFISPFNSFGIKQSQLDKLVFGKPDSVVAQRVNFKAHMMIGMHGDPTEPRIENVVLPTIRAIRTDASGRPIENGKT